jgi:hypothetical protein
LGGGAGVKYIDTQLTGNVKITFELAPANNVLFRGVNCAINGGVGTPFAGLEYAACTIGATLSSRFKLLILNGGRLFLNKFLFLQINSIVKKRVW